MFICHAPFTRNRTTQVDTRGYARDVTGNITAITDNLDATRSRAFGYDTLCRLTAATGIYGTLTYGYDAVGNRLSQTAIPAQAGTQNVTTYNYATDANRLLGVADATGNAPYQYDAAGNTLSDGTQSFAYDARNRFTQADGLYTYTHNALGQRVTKPRFQTAVPGDASGDAVINEQDLHALRDVIKGNAPATYGADCNGDGAINNKDVSCIANQLGGTKNNGNGNGEKADGTVGATSSRTMLASTEVGDIVGNILFAYDEAGHLVGEYDELGSAIREYVWLGDRPVAMMAGDHVYYIHSDHFNTPKVVTDENQSIVWRADYQPFGEITETISTVEMPLRYPGQIADDETGLSYNWNRSYDSATGRYTQSDPIGIYGGLNTYGYVFQNPLRLTDPTGESPAALCPILIAADGPFPVGDIACGCLVVATAAAAINAANGTGEALNSPATPANCPNPPDDDGSGGSCDGGDPCKGLRNQLRAHEQKLREYKANPYAHDNQGHLAGNPTSLHQQIIDGRIRSLQRQIENFRKLLEQCERENGGR